MRRMNASFSLASTCAMRKSCQLMATSQAAGNPADTTAKQINQTLKAFAGNAQWLARLPGWRAIVESWRVQSLVAGSAGGGRAGQALASISVGSQELFPINSRWS